MLIGQYAGGGSGDWNYGGLPSLVSYMPISLDDADLDWVQLQPYTDVSGTYHPYPHTAKLTQTGVSHLYNNWYLHFPTAFKNAVRSNVAVNARIIRDSINPNLYTIPPEKTALKITGTHGSAPDYAVAVREGIVGDSLSGAVIPLTFQDVTDFFSSEDISSYDF